MPNIKYVEKDIGQARLGVIAAANAIISHYAAQGFQLTLRQLYYQFVSKDLIANNQKSYSLLGDIINDGRLVGLIDWNAIVDRTRNLQSVAHHSSPSDAVSQMAGYFRIDKWADQPYRPEVWIEKDALVGVIEGVCTSLDVPFFSCRGYTSQSEMWGAGRRLRRYLKAGQTPIIFHLGDHDPSGKDMTRDIRARLAMFAEQDVRVKRLALNMKQVEHYNPPPNFAKLSDARAKKYIAKYGNKSWELDALEPSVLVGLIRKAVKSVRDEGKWLAKKAEELTHRELLNATSMRWPEVVHFLEP
jgi:hypothetical protein